MTDARGVVVELCRVLGVDPRNVKQIQIDEAAIFVEVYVIAPDGERIDHRRPALTERMSHIWPERVIGTAKGKARRREVS
jgi:hypothetical protein